MENDCNYKSGLLPVCAPLALAYVPEQQEAEPVYKQMDALSQGTLFPGLNLPLMDKMGREISDPSPLTELMAVDFVCKELNLYLDTHPNDMQAFAAYRTFLKLAEQGRAKYVERYGPLMASDMANAGSYTWIKNPWPWDYSANKGD